MAVNCVCDEPGHQLCENAVPYWREMEQAARELHQQQQVVDDSQDESCFQEIAERLEKECANLENPEVTLTEVVVAPLTPDDGMLMHSGALEFIPDTDMETLPIDFDQFAFETTLPLTRW